MGWRLVAGVYAVGCGAFSLLWHAVAANTPADWPRVGRLLPGMNEAEVALLTEDKEVTAGPKSRLIPMYLLKTPAAYAPCLAHIADCLTVYSLMQWGPTIYAERFGCTEVQIGFGRFVASEIKAPIRLANLA